MIAATNSWCVCFDNQSSLAPWLSDALCRLATGGGFSTRELYSDNEETIFDAMRPLIINSIEDLATRGDLMDRAVLLSLPPIPEHRRRLERDLWKEFEQERPRILGALLTAVSGALRELPRVQLDGLPRMADFAEWAIAAETALDCMPGSFLSAYGENRKDANEVALEASPSYRSCAGSSRRKASGWGTPRALLVELGQLAGEAETKKRDWPANAKVLSGRLKRLAPNLRSVGIIAAWDREEGMDRRRIIRLSCQRDKGRDFASGASGASDDAKNPGERGIAPDASGRKRTQADAPNHSKTARQDAPDAPDAPSRTSSYTDPDTAPPDLRTPFAGREPGEEG